MLVRRCSQGNDIAVYKNSKPGMKKTIQLANGEMSVLTYPSAAKDYFVAFKRVKNSTSILAIQDVEIAMGASTLLSTN